MYVVIEANESSMMYVVWMGFEPHMVPLPDLRSKPPCRLTHPYCVYPFRATHEVSMISIQPEQLPVDEDGGPYTPPDAVRQLRVVS
jgi:hypothetical protein